MGSIPFALAALTGAGGLAAGAGTLATIGTAASVASAGIGIEAARAQGKYAEYVAKRSQFIAEEHAKDAREEGISRAQVAGVEGKQARGRLIAGQGASGISVGSPGALRALGSLDRMIQREQELAATDGRKRSRAFRIGKQAFSAQASQSGYAARTKALGIAFGSAGDLLSDGSFFAGG